MTTTARSTPGGSALEDGFSVKIAFAADPDVSLWEKSVQPPGVDGGEQIDVTTMFNTDWRTFAPRSLKSLTELSIVAAYDPAVYDQIVALINDNGWITVHFPDGSKLDFVGYLKNFAPQALQEGQQPTANCSIVPTNMLAGVETDPVYTAPA